MLQHFSSPLDDSSNVRDRAEGVWFVRFYFHASFHALELLTQSLSLRSCIARYCHSHVGTDEAIDQDDCNVSLRLEPLQRLCIRLYCEGLSADSKQR